MRIAHFGDIGQKELTPEQLKILGSVDVAITQFSNPWSNMDIKNKKGFKLMDQLKPKIIIPTDRHTDTATAKYAAEKWDAYYADNPIHITKDATKGNTKLLFLGERMRGFAEACKAKKWGF